jgi:hypothetical protein
VLVAGDPGWANVVVWRRERAPTALFTAEPGEEIHDQAAEMAAELARDARWRVLDVRNLVAPGMDPEGELLQ